MEQILDTWTRQDNMVKCYNKRDYQLVAQRFNLGKKKLLSQLERNILCTISQTKCSKRRGKKGRATVGKLEVIFQHLHYKGKQLT